MTKGRVSYLHELDIKGESGNGDLEFKFGAEWEA